MTFLAKLLFSLVGINALLLMISLGYHRPLPRELPELPNIATRTDPYRFLDPPLAFQVLSKLDVFNETLSPASVFNTSYLGFKIDDNYCEKQRAYFVEYPEAAFEEVNLVHSFGINSFVAQAISPVANDIHGARTSKLSRNEKESFILDVKPETTVFFTTRSLSSFYTLTKHVSCLFQESNQIPGQSKFSLKDLVARASSEYVKKFEGRSHCINHDKYFPKTWLLNDPQECKEFFENLMSPEYTRLKEERKIVYIKKFPAEHRGIGVIPLNSIEEQNLRKQYKNGTLCGQIPKIIVMQHYIHNSLLLHGHKFDFRMYMLIASVNPLIAYYHDGFLRVTLAEYDASSTDKKVLLTNLALNEQIYDDASKGILYKGQTEEDLKQAQQWSFDRLQAYLLVVGVIKDPNWLDNYLRPELKKAMIHLVRLSSDNFGIHSSFYGLYGVDFMLDTDLNLWFIESNSGPAFDGYSEPMGKFVGKMLTDHLEIVIGLLRSRMKRTINFVNKLIQERVVYEVAEGEVVIENLEETRKEFERITMNYFEKEFEVSEGNGFAKIIDENEQGENVYQGWIDTDCLNF